MADVIEEIPIEEAATMEEVVATETPPEKRKRGRPKGSKNKAPKNADVPEEAPKPKQPRKRRPPSPQSESPPPLRRRRAPAAVLQQPEPAPPLDSRQIAAEVLQLLSTRHLDLRQAKREKYRAWFQ